MVHQLCIIMLDTDATNELKCTFLSEHQIGLYFNPFLFSSSWLPGVQEVPHGTTFTTVKRETNCITVNQRGSGFEFSNLLTERLSQTNDSSSHVGFWRRD